METTDQGTITKRQLDAKQYLDEYDLEMVVSEMLNSLLHEKDKHPYVYMIKYLAGLMTDDERKEFNLSIPEPYPTARPVVKYPKFNPASDSLLKKYLDKEEWEKLRHVKTKYGNNINSMTNLSVRQPTDPIGCVLIDGDCQNAYSSVLNKIIADVHQISEDFSSLKEFQLSNFIQLRPSDLPLAIKELEGKTHKMILSYSRNITEFPFNHFASGTNKLEAVEALIVKSISGLRSDNIIPVYKEYTLIENKETADDLLNYISYDMDWLKAAGLTQNWPQNRRILATDDKSLIILINFSDHLQIYVSKKKGSVNIVEMYNKANEILKQMSLVMSFESSKYLGFLTSNINTLGAGFNILSWINFENLSSKKLKDDINITDIFEGLNFDVFDEPGGLFFSSQSWKLSDENEKDFLTNYLSKLCGLSCLDSDDKLSTEISFKKLSLPKSSDSMANEAIVSVYDQIYEHLKYQLSSQGNNINALVTYYSLNPSNKLGIVLHDSSEYHSFNFFVQQYILISQNFDTKTTDHIHKPDTPKQMAEITEKDIGKLSNVSICLMRNIEGHQFPHSAVNTNMEVEEMIQNAIETSNFKGHFATYYSLNDQETKDHAMALITQRKLVLYHDDLMTKCKMDNDYPLHRGVIQFSRENLFAIVNDIDHMRFTLTIDKPNSKFGYSLVSLLKVVNEFSKHIIFSYDMKLGFLTSSPKYLGTGLDIKLELNMSTISKQELMKYADEHPNEQFQFEFLKENNDKSYQIIVKNKVTIGISETELLTNLLLFLNELITLDKQIE